MMTQSPRKHLNHDELLKALVSRADLADDRQKHFNDCPECRHALEQLQGRFEYVGRMAKHMAPSPAKSFRLSEQTPAPTRWRVRPLWATGLVAVLILALGIWWPLHLEDNGLPPIAVQDLEAERQLMIEIDALVIDALPAAYQMLASSSEPDNGGDLINWVVPSIQEEVDDSLI